MKRMVLITVLILFAATFCFADVYVQGYYKSNGTYVAPHYRSDPNSTTLDNWSTKGNVNPYTGQYGTKPAYPSPPSRTSTPTTTMFGTYKPSQQYYY